MFIELNYKWKIHLINFWECESIDLIDSIWTKDNPEWWVSIYYNYWENSRTYRFDNLNDRDIFYERIKNLLCTEKTKLK